MESLVTIYKKYNYVHTAYFNKEALDMINLDTVLIHFSTDGTIRIKAPTIDSSKTFKIGKHNTISIGTTPDYLDLSGNYTLYRENEDSYLLIKKQ